MTQEIPHPLDILKNNIILIGDKIDVIMDPNNTKKGSKFESV